MAVETRIEWADATFNGWIGCEKVSPACAMCYAEVDTFARMKRAQGVELWGRDAARHRTSPSYWLQLRKWNKDAKESGDRTRVFCHSLSDVFEDRRDLDPWRADLFREVEACEHLDFLFLTKRTQHMIRLAPESWRERWPANVWAGTTVEDQAHANERIPHLLEVPARIHWLSVEPLLAPLDLSNFIKQPWMPDHIVKPHSSPIEFIPVRGIDWVIVGGESGRKPRPMDEDWVRTLRDQCVPAGVAFFYKQKVEGGKKIGTPELDGKRWVEVPL